MAKKQKFYVVWKGKMPGVYDSWAACQRQVAGFPNAQYKSYESRKEAETALKKGYSPSFKQ